MLLAARTLYCNHLMHPYTTRFRGGSRAARATCPECALSLSAAGMLQSSLGGLQAVDDMADAAADAEDSEQHSSESDLTPSGRLQQQQQVGWAFSDDRACTQLIHA